MSNVLLVLKETLWPLTPSLRAASPKLASWLTTSTFVLSVFSLCTPPSHWYPALASWQTNSHSCKAEQHQQSFTDSLCPLLKLSVSISASPPLVASSSHSLALCTFIHFIIHGYSGPSSTISERTEAAQSYSYHASKEIQIWVIFPRVLDRSLLKAERNLTVFSLSFSWANTNQNLFWFSSWDLSLSHPWPHTHRLPYFELCF